MKKYQEQIFNLMDFLQIKSQETELGKAVAVSTSKWSYPLDPDKRKAFEAWLVENKLEHKRKMQPDTLTALVNEEREKQFAEFDGDPDEFIFKPPPGLDGQNYDLEQTRFYGKKSK